MKKISSLDYAYALGKIRALENFLITKEVFEQAIETDLTEALRLFVESGMYPPELLHIQNSRQLESILTEELLQIKKTVSHLLLDENLKAFIEIKSLQVLREIVIDYSSEFLSDYVFYLIDMHNLKSFLRLYSCKEPEAKLKEALTCEGFIRKEDFLRLYAGDLAHFLNRLEYVHKGNQTLDYSSFLGEAIHRVEKDNSFISLERAINDFLFQALQPAKYINFGPEPLLAHYFAKVNEINLMRMIILAKLNAFSRDLVKERLNFVYA